MMATRETISGLLQLLAGNFPHVQIGEPTAILWMRRFEFVPDAVLRTAVLRVIDHDDSGFWPTIAQLWAEMPEKERYRIAPDEYWQLEPDTRRQLGNPLEGRKLGELNE